jgi:hypothetical protein
MIGINEKYVLRISDISESYILYYHGNIVREEGFFM